MVKKNKNIEIIINDKILGFSENDGKYWNIYFKYHNITQIIRKSDQYQELCQIMPNISFVIYWQKARSASRADNIESSQDMSGIQPGGHPASGPTRPHGLSGVRTVRTYRAGPDFRGVFAKIRYNQFWPEYKRGRNIREGEYKRGSPCIYILSEIWEEEEDDCQPCYVLPPYPTHMQ